MIEIFFEGDGQLGIEWGNKGGRLVVKRIIKSTVADEYYELKNGLCLRKINDEDCDSVTYMKNVSKIINIWNETNEIKLTFEYIGEENYEEVYNFLDKNGCKEYYDNFVELGAKKIEDFEYIEIDDLYKMGLSLDQADRLFRKIKMKSNSEVFEEL